jgi:hypothetical protein
MSETTKTLRIQDNFFDQIQSNAVNVTYGKVFIERNRIKGVSRALEIFNNDTVLISKNNISYANDGIYLTGTAKYQVDANVIRYGKGTGISLSSGNNARISNNWISNTENISTKGISISNSSNISLLFNAINVTGTNNNSSAIDVQNGRNISVFNNIIKNASGGYCMKLSNNSTLISDYNCYYAPLNNIGAYNDKLYNDLDQWGSILKGEASSIFINPFFRNNEDYKPNHILLNDAGIRYEPVSHDIDSSVRNNVSPDIGAKEFVPCDIDAGINEFTSPSLSLATGKQDIKVVLQNQGLLPLTKVRIHWSLNGAQQPVFIWTGNL